SAQPFVSNGIAAMQSQLSAHPDRIKALIAATLRGLDYVDAHPQDAVNLSKKYVPGLDDPTSSADALAVLQATIPLWQPNGTKPGYNDPAAWQAMTSFFQAHNQLGGPV